MKRIFLDANVLFTAAHNPRGKASFLIELSAGGQWTLFTSAYAVEEARRNISIKFPEKSKQLETLLAGITVIKSSKAHPCPAGLNTKDQPIFQAAVECSATHLLTGDVKDFGPFMNQVDATFNIIIQTVNDFFSAYS